MTHNSNPHPGNANCYRTGCRQNACRDAFRPQQKHYRYRAHRMGGSTTVDSTRAAQVIVELSKRMSYSAIGRAINSSHNYITKIERGQIKRISPEREAAILGLHDYRPTDSSHVNPLGARRRLQALVALGYSKARLARETGCALNVVKETIAGDWPVIEARNDQAIRATYERLSMRIPTPTREDSMQERSGITRARNIAKRAGWAPPLAWDNIDTDDAPQGTEVQSAAEIREARRAELTHMAENGATIEETAAAMGLTRDALYRWSDRNGCIDLYRSLSARGRVTVGAA